MFKKLSAAVFAAFLLTGCRPAVTSLEITSGSRLAAAGFKSVSVPGIKGPEGASTSLGTFACPAADCGAQTYLILGVMTPASRLSADLTIEEALKLGLGDTGVLEKEMRRKAAGGFSSNGKTYGADVLNVAFSTKRATLDFRFRFTGKDEKPVFLSTRGRFVANNYRFVMSLSQNAAAASRYARPAWIP